MNHPPPWYKQFWPWFLLGILSLSIVMSTTFLVLSITSFDGMVEDNYYKVGKAINETLEQDDRAEALNMVAELRIDDLTGEPVNPATGRERDHSRIRAGLDHGRDQQRIAEHVIEARVHAQLGKREPERTRDRPAIVGAHVRPQVREQPQVQTGELAIDVEHAFVEFPGDVIAAGPDLHDRHQRGVFGPAHEGLGRGRRMAVATRVRGEQRKPARTEREPGDDRRR